MQSNRRIKVVLFDLGSTLIFFDSIWDTVIPQCDQAMLESLREAGFHPDGRFIEEFHQREEEHFRKFDKLLIEYPLVEILSELMVDHGYPNACIQIARSGIDAYFSVSQSHWHPEEETLPTIQSLKAEGYRLGMISNAGDEKDVLSLMEKTGVRTYFDQVLVSSSVRIRKPSPKIFQIALDFFGIKGSDAVMVGDTLAADILGANNAGVGSVWITMRADRPDNRSLMGEIKPDAEIENLSALPNLLQSW
jgi:HAD superfamily hydrolase (TIGR01662 family)